MTGQDAAAAPVPPAFQEPVLEAQGAFRATMRAMSRPGLPVRLTTGLATPEGLMPATASIVLTLCDFETPVWLDDALRTEAVERYIRFHSGCPIVDEPGEATFALAGVPHRMPPLSDFDCGDDKYPERSATLILQVESLDSGQTYRLSGPGIQETVDLSVRGLPAAFSEDWRTNNAQYPTGVDVMLACDDRFVGLPRSVKLEG